MPENAQNSDTILWKYCTCAGIYLANSMNNESMESTAKAEQINPKITTRAVNFCRENYDKY